MNIFNNLAHNVGGFWGYMLWCLGEILREPFSGIMEFEVKLLKCVVVYARVALEAYGSILLTLLAIYVIVYFVLANRMPHFHMHVGRWIGIIVSVITARIISITVTLIKRLVLFISKTLQAYRQES